MRVAVRPPGQTSEQVLAVSAEGTWVEADGDSAPELGAGWWALPGLADAHSHLAADEMDLAPGDPAEIRRRAFACVERGTFLVIDKGWSDNTVLATLEGAPPGESPDLEGAGRMIAVEGGYFPGFAVETDRGGLEKAVQTAVGEGKGWVKLVGDWPRKGRGALPNFDEEALSAAVAVAHRAGAKVAIHTMAPDVASWAVWAGVDSIEHGLFLSEADLAELARRQGAWVPTVTRMEATMEMLGETSTGGRLISWALGNMPLLLRDAPEGLAVLAGTDLAVPSGEVAEEALGLARLGLAPDRAVDAASTAVRRYLGRSEGFGVGESADAVFFAADPYDDPSALRDPVAVLRAGERIR